MIYYSTTPALPIAVGNRYEAIFQLETAELTAPEETPSVAEPCLVAKLTAEKWSRKIKSTPAATFTSLPSQA